MDGAVYRPGELDGGVDTWPGSLDTGSAAQVAAWWIRIRREGVTVRRLLAIAVLVLGSVGPVEAASTGATITITCPKENYRITVPAAWKQKPCKGGAGALAARDMAAIGVDVAAPTIITSSQLAEAILKNAGVPVSAIARGTQFISGVRFQTLAGTAHDKKTGATGYISFAVATRKGKDYLLICYVRTSHNPQQGLQAQQVHNAIQSFRFLR